MNNILKVKTPFSEDDLNKLWEETLVLSDEDFIEFYDYWLKHIFLKNFFGKIYDRLYDPDGVFRDMIRVTENPIFSSSLKIATADLDLSELDLGYTLKFGYKRFDKIVEPTVGEVIILGARPSVGKTTFMLNLLKRALTSEDEFFTGEIRAAFLSLEMSKREIISRLLMMFYNVTKDELKRRLDKYRKDKRVKELLSRVVIYTGPSNIDAIMGFMRRMIFKGVRLFFIDYVQLIGAKGKFSNRNEMISFISRQIKTFATTNESILFVGSQLSRDAARGESPDLHLLRDSGALEQDADTVIFLDPQQEGLHALLNLVVKKHRNGALGIIPMLFNKPTQTFSETKSFE